MDRLPAAPNARNSRSHVPLALCRAAARAAVRAAAARCHALMQAHVGKAWSRQPTQVEQLTGELF